MELNINSPKYYKEVKYCSVAYGFADVNLFVDYEKYIESTMDEKKSLVVKMLLIQ